MKIKKRQEGLKNKEKKRRKKNEGRETERKGRREGGGKREEERKGGRKEGRKEGKIVKLFRFIISSVLNMNYLEYRKSIFTI